MECFSQFDPYEYYKGKKQIADYMQAIEQQRLLHIENGLTDLKDVCVLVLVYILECECTV